MITEHLMCDYWNSGLKPLILLILNLSSTIYSYHVGQQRLSKSQIIYIWCTENKNSILTI